ncbi:hypothetical protein GGTG_08736 [Gaeumannomyces tritici R3-111a-1]|uniref:Uncharacterized protein n=1 Tax=Gaeumannomyces tritici (strain R3-111a-1) TaxID=644352 RepID=J3P5E7_GAET3|nr:hypothetical protein GGTG_08736 [Gaeumannomyces tritici R3-111a-1]EJT74898.1 hypothetical protein GGTG_08736 [Gaeumannomyces tritici R3-111a-1]
MPSTEVRRLRCIAPPREPSPTEKMRISAPYNDKTNMHSRVAVSPTCNHGT